jgi:CRP-like cAMP-binding protein
MSNTPDIDINLLRQFSPLDSLSEANLKELKGHVSELRLSKGKILFKRDQINKDLFFVLSGAVDLLDENFEVEKITAPNERSRQTLDMDEPHSKTAVTTSEVKLLRLSKDRLDLVMTWDQAGGYLVEDLSDDESIVDNDWMASLLGSQLFQQVPPANLQQLFVKFRETPTIAGDAIVKEGERGDRFYVVQHGHCQVTRRGDRGSTQKLATLYPGQYFGEEALIGDTVRNATVTMSTDGVLMSLDKADFKTLLEEPVVQYINDSELQHLLDSDERLRLLDVRLSVEIPPADRRSRLVIPLSDLRTRIQELEEDTTYVLTKEGGRRSVLGAYLINEFGFKGFVLK